MEAGRGITLTMEHHSVPEEWSSPELESEARHQALVQIYEDEREDEDIRDMAREEANASFG